MKKTDSNSHKSTKKKKVSQAFTILISIVVAFFIIATIITTISLVLKEPDLSNNKFIKTKLLIMAILVCMALIMYMLTSWFITLRNNKIIYRLSVEDQTTKLLNRTAYEQYANAHISKELHYISVIYMDANGLHEINNNFGHEKGDLFLLAIANTLKKYFLSDSIYRIGGDEFVVIIENSHYESVAELTAQAAHELEQTNYFVSYGIAYREKSVGISVLTKEADEKMLDNKKKYYEMKRLKMRNPLKKDD